MLRNAQMDCSGNSCCCFSMSKTIGAIFMKLSSRLQLLLKRFLYLKFTYFTRSQGIALLSTYDFFGPFTFTIGDSSTVCGIFCEQNNPLLNIWITMFKLILVLQYSRRQTEFCSFYKCDNIQVVVCGNLVKFVNTIWDVHHFTVSIYD